MHLILSRNQLGHRLSHKKYERHEFLFLKNIVDNY
jgi:hypothetical protein